MIDFHTHLDLYTNPVEIAAETNRVNIFTLAVTTSPRAWQATSRYFSHLRNIQVALGLHPEIVSEKAVELSIILDNISSTRFIGEIGLDGSPKHRSTYALQIKIFEEILRNCSKIGGRILSIHSRSAASDVVSLISKYSNAGKPVLHWYSGSQTDLNKAIDCDCWFSVGPSMIKSKSGRALVAKMPRNRILPESDGPFATFRNSPIMPWDAISINYELSDIWGTSMLETEQILRSNLRIILE